MLKLTYELEDRIIINCEAKGTYSDKIGKVVCPHS